MNSSYVNKNNQIRENLTTALMSFVKGADESKTKGKKIFFIINKKNPEAKFEIIENFLSFEIKLFNNFSEENTELVKTQIQEDKAEKKEIIMTQIFSKEEKNNTQNLKTAKDFNLNFSRIPKTTTEEQQVCLWTSSKEFFEEICHDISPKNFFNNLKEIILAANPIN